MTSKLKKKYANRSTIGLTGKTLEEISNIIQEAWFKINNEGTNRKMIMETGREGSIMMHERLIGRPLTREERLTFEEGRYSAGSGSEPFIKHYPNRREDLEDGTYAFNFKRDGVDMYVVEQYQDHYRVNHKYIDEKEYKELTKDLTN